MADPLKLNIGCGTNGIGDDWVNCDIYAGPNVQCVFDAQQEWPFKDNTVQAIYASHMLEHLRDPLAFFREAWRVLMPGGTVLIRVPYGGHNLAWVDLTHIRPWFAETFCMLQPGYNEAVGNPQHSGWHWPFGVSADVRISGKYARLMRWWPMRRFLLEWGEAFHNYVEELWIHAFALKTDEATRTYREVHGPNAITRRWMMYRHQWERRSHLRPGERPEFVYFSIDEAMIGFHNWKWR